MSLGRKAYKLKSQIVCRIMVIERDRVTTTALLPPGEEWGAFSCHCSMVIRNPTWYYLGLENIT